MADRPPNPDELEFVVSADATGIDVVRRESYDLYTAAGHEHLPLVVFVHGPVPSDATRPRDWPVYRGYGAIAAQVGAASAVLDLDYPDPRSPSAPEAQLRDLVAAVRAEKQVDQERVVIWAFSGGARLVGRWLEEPPPWIAGVALTYPVVPSVRRVIAPIVVTRVELDQPDVQASLDALLAGTDRVELIDVPGGRHGFDMLDHNDQSRRAVNAALDSVRHLLVA
jgi:acetyl esterase/lipase